MARPTKVFLRKLRKSEKELLKVKLRDKTVSARIYERYRVIDIVQQGFSVPEIAERSGMFVTSIYDWIQYFNKHGFRGFDDPPNPEGRPSLLTFSPPMPEDSNPTLTLAQQLGAGHPHGACLVVVLGVDRAGRPIHPQAPRSPGCRIVRSVPPVTRGGVRFHPFIGIGVGQPAVPVCGDVGIDIEVVSDSKLSGKLQVVCHDGGTVHLL